MGGVGIAAVVRATGIPEATIRRRIAKAPRANRHIGTLKPTHGGIRYDS
jgi:hypothetical protein